MADLVVDRSLEREREPTTACSRQADKTVGRPHNDRVYLLD